MYEQHFGFSRPMFSDGVAVGDAVFRPEPYAKLVEDLEIALSRKDAVAVLAGEAGTGKSTLAGSALRETSTQLAFTCLSHVPLTPHELQEQLLSDFGYEPYALSRVERLQAWRQFLAEMAATATRVGILVEGAERLSVDVLQGLHSFTAADAAHNPGANVILTTIQPAERIWARSGLQPLRQRVRLSRETRAFSAAETEGYLAFKAHYAGVDASAIFTDHVAETVHALAGGVVRVIDCLLESSLQFAAAAGEARLTAALVESVAADQLGLGRPTEIPTLTDSVPPLDAGATLSAVPTASRSARRDRRSA